MPQPTASTLPRASRALILTAWLSLVGALFAAALLGLDPRVLAGEPLWLKPFKFFVSVVILAVTLEWILARGGDALPAVDRWRRIIAWGSAFELLVIVGQAARGEKSHFNFATPLDGSVFVVMGLVISLVVIGAVRAVFLATRSRSRLSRSERAAARVGIVVLALAGFSGNLMSRPTPSQLATMQAGALSPRIGSHFVGSEEGATRTAPMVGWSLESGDLRVAHFLGLHILQVLLAVTFVMRRRGLDLEAPQRARTVTVLGVTLAFGVALTLVEALLGRTAFDPGATFWALRAVWIAAVAVAAARALRSDARRLSVVGVAA
jgi:hypothetical protein